MSDTGDFQCRICKNISQNNVFHIKEQMFGTHKDFAYFQCADCGCMQIADSIDDISGYYPEDYYSFNESGSFLYRLKDYIEDYLLKHVEALQLGKKDIIGAIAAHYKEYYEYYFKWLDGVKISADSSILDVGCGAGVLLRRLSVIGYKNLYGIDPYLKHDIVHQNYRIDKKNPEELSGEFDLIMLHHSFEHMENPHEVLDILKQHLQPGGIILIRIPVMNSYAWKEFGENWFQLDAPRHLYLYTVESLRYLAESHDLSIRNIIFDSTGKQFVYSERYKHNLRLDDSRLSFSRKELRTFKERAALLNESHQGDQACFFLEKKVCESKS